VHAESGRASTVDPIVRRPFLLLLAVAVALLTGCQARSTVSVVSNSNGTGSVAVVVLLDREAANAIPDLKEQLQTSDLVKAGWTVEGPVDWEDGGKAVTVHHGFGSPEEATALMRRISGNGPPFVDFQMQQQRSLMHVDTTFSGKIDMKQGMNSFGDLGLTQSLGSRLGFDPNEIEKSLGVNWATAFPVDVQVSLPGKTAKAEAVYGQVVPINASASGPNTRPWAFFALSAASLIGCFLVLLLWKSGKYRPKHKKGVRARDLLNQKSE
jgi:hypothetical protein